MELLHIGRNPPAHQPITHIDVRLTVADANYITGVLARFTHAVAKACGEPPREGDSMFRTLHRALGSEYRDVGDERLALVPTGIIIDPLGYAEVPRCPSSRSEDVVVRHDDGTTSSYTVTHAAARIKELAATVAESSDVIRENHKVQGRQAETIAAQTREIERLNGELATVRAMKSIVANGTEFTPGQAANRIEADAKLILHLREHRDALRRELDSLPTTQQFVYADGIGYAPDDAGRRIESLERDYRRHTQDIERSATEIKRLNEQVNLQAAAARKEKEAAKKAGEHMRKLVGDLKLAVSLAEVIRDDLAPPTT